MQIQHLHLQPTTKLGAQEGLQLPVNTCSVWEARASGTQSFSSGRMRVEEDVGDQIPHELLYHQRIIYVDLLFCLTTTRIVLKKPEVKHGMAIAKFLDQTH